MITLYLTTSLLFLSSAIAASFLPPNYKTRTALTPRDSDNCYAKSLALTNFTIYAAQVLKGSPFKQENSSIAFQLFNTATNTDAQCSAYSAALTPNSNSADPYIWYGCFMESRDPSMAAKFRYDATLNYVTINETWTCLDPQNHTVLFTAYNFDELAINCTDDGSFERWQCTQADGDKLYFPVDITTKRL
ncbi:hypothetical protein B0T22DRAFT_513101 [Podospora appendiculata]|uniref:AA1-like domain-containing protein n=1 Tax=Podospora appendiculata TaxID=314037 RepID=A0AAE1CD47_9PEZI|nr:hypothetical protein B0T22DRAFT_513101 [Podospora appendiculata]